MTMRSKLSRAAGFTLVELMVTILIASILASIAIPTYTTQVRKSRRTDARTAVLDLATREERYFSVSNSYSNLDTNLGYSNATTGAAISGLSVGNGYYTVAVTVTAAAAATATAAATQAGYSITATAVGTQAKDTQCATFTIDQTGKQSSSPSTTCWN